METLVSMLVVMIIFACIAYALWWICTRFALSPPVLWLVGGILLIFLLLYAARVLGVSSIRFS